MTRWLREPFVRFVLLGALIFAAHALAATRGGDGDSRRIDVTASDIAHLRAVAQRQWGRAPDAAQTRVLVQDFVREEVLVREARAEGLDRDDVIVRRRLAQKMEFLAQQDVTAPDDAAVAAYFHAHAGRYATAPAVTIEQRWFSRDARPDAEGDARRALAALQAGHEAVGDRLMVGDRLSDQTEGTLAGTFGEAFAQVVMALPVGAWSGPVASPLGVHVVRVVSRRPPGPPSLDAVRERVRADLMEERAKAAREAAYARQRARYQVYVAALPGGTP